MKHFFLTLMICTVAGYSFAQTVFKDSAAAYNAPDTAYHAPKTPGFSVAITFSRIDFGLASLRDNGSFTLSQNNKFLSYRQWKSNNFGFDLLQAGYRFNSSFKIYVSGGFDWTYYRLRNNVTIQRGTPSLSYTTDNINYSKNSFSSSYLRIPLSFYYRSHDDANGNCFRFVAGPELGLLLNGKQKQISDENGKQVFTNGYHFTQWRKGVFVRMGYGILGVYAKYYFSDMFQDSPDQAGLRGFSAGLTLGF